MGMTNPIIKPDALSLHFLDLAVPIAAWPVVFVNHLNF